jgi:nicotinamide mononucleotide adenylyltransferase
VLDHIKHEINDVLGGIADAQGDRREARVALLAGGDLLQTMSTPGVWSEADLQRILGGGGMYVLERHGVDIYDAKPSLAQYAPSLAQYADNIHLIPQGYPNDVSSTKVRLW